MLCADRCWCCCLMLDAGCGLFFGMRRVLFSVCGWSCCSLWVWLSMLFRVVCALLSVARCVLTVRCCCSLLVMLMVSLFVACCMRRFVVCCLLLVVGIVVDGV